MMSDTHFKLCRLKGDLSRIELELMKAKSPAIYNHLNRYKAIIKKDIKELSDHIQNNQTTKIL